MGFETPKGEEILRLLTPRYVLAVLNRKKRFILTIHSAPQLIFFYKASDLLNFLRPKFIKQRPKLIDSFPCQL